MSEFAGIQYNTNSETFGLTGSLSVTAPAGFSIRGAAVLDFGPLADLLSASETTSVDPLGNSTGTFYGFGVDSGSLVNPGVSGVSAAEFSSLSGYYSSVGLGDFSTNPFDFSNATYIDAGEFSGVPGIGLSYPSLGYNGAYDTEAYDFSGNFAQSASQLAGIGLSLTSDLGGGGFTSYADYDFTPGQTSNSVFDYFGGVGYSPSFDYSGNGYVSYDYSNYDFSNYSAYDFSGSGFSSDYFGGSLYGGNLYGGYGGSAFDYDPFQSFGQSYSDFVSSDFDFGFPVVLDLAGTGIKIDPLTSSNFFYDMAGDGYRHRTAWAGAGNGVLVLDLAGTGEITERNQVIFTDWDPTATSDMEALANVFDTNRDGVLDASDTQFSAFKILVTNADGTTTLQTLAQAGVASINLNANAVATVLPDGSQIQGQTTFTKIGGGTGTAATVSLTYDGQGYAVTQTVTNNPDGSTTINNKALDADGRLANETTTVTSADGLSRTVTFDADGDGVADQIQTIVTVLNGNGSTTETLTNKTAANVVLDSTITTISADRAQTSITRDSNGNGVADQSETRVNNANGSTSIVINDLNANGSVRASSTTTTSIDGLTRTANLDLDGDSDTDQTSIDSTVVAGATRTRTVTSQSPTGALLSRTVTTTTNGQTTSITRDYNGDALNDLLQAFAFTVGMGGSKVTTETDTSRNGTTLATVVTTIAADGLSTTVATDNNGDGQTDRTTSDVTVVANGVRTQTVSENNGDGSLRAQTVTVKGADGRSRTIEIDANGDGDLDQTETIVINGSGVSVDTLSNLNADGSLIDKSVVTTSADGLSVATQRDFDGDGVFDLLDTNVTVKNGDGSSKVTSAAYAASGAIIEKSVTATSADGLSITTQNDTNGDGVYEVATSDITVVNGDQSRVQTVTSNNTNGSLRAQTVTSISADRQTVVVTSDANGDGNLDLRRETVIQADGTTIDTTTNLNPDKSITSQLKTTTSANGLSRTIQSDLNGDAVFDTTQSDVTVLNADGSKTTTVSQTNANGSLRSQVVASVSADGYATTTQTDADGNSLYELTSINTTVFSADGSQTVSAINKNADATVRNASTVTTSFNGLSTTTTTDINGDGTNDRLGSDVTVLNANGSTVRTVSERNGDNSLRTQSVTTTSADQLTLTIVIDSNGDGFTDQSQTVSTAANGIISETVVNLNSDGSRKDSTQTQTSANGLVVTTAIDRNGDLVTDLQTVERTTLNTDGSATKRTDTYSGTTLVQSQSVLTSADGRSVTTTTDIDGDGKIDLTTTDVTVYNADGSTIKTVTSLNQDGSQRDKTITTTSADARSTTIVGYIDNSGLPKYQKTILSQNDGSALTTVTYPNETKPILASETDTRLVSADGLNETTRIVNSSATYLDVASNTGLNADGSRTTTFLNQKSFQYDAVETVSDDGLSKTIQWTGPALQDIPELTLDGTETTVFNADGSTTKTILNTITQETANSASATARSVTNVSDDGLSTTRQLDIDHNGSYDQADSLITALDGSTVRTTSTFNPGTGVLLQKDVISTSFDGRQQTVQRDDDGDGIYEHSESSVTNSNGSVTRTISETAAGGALLAQIVEATAANGFSKAVSMDVDGDGTIDFTQLTTTTINADGSRRTTVSDLFGNGALRDLTVTTVSANGLSTTTQYDLNGDGVIDETQTDVTAYLSTGVKTQTITTRYADGTLKDSATTTTTQNGYKSVENTDYDVNGDGVVDRYLGVGLDQDGYRLSTTQWYPNGPGNGGPRIDTGTDPDGTTTFFVTYGADGTRIAQDSLFLLPNANGSYIYQTKDNLTGVIQTFTHTIDENNVDNWVWTIPGTATYQTVRLDLATEERLFEIARRVYDTVFDRSISQGETQQLIKYISNSDLDATALINDLLGSSEFALRYGTLTNIQYIERVYQNALNRFATLGEVTDLLTQLNNGTLSRAAVALQVSESSEHIFVGNGHAVTNNTSKNPFTAITLDHSTDKQIVSALVQAIYDVVLDRQATAAEATTESNEILALTNARTEYQVASDILASNEFAAKYGTLDNGAFVSQMFQNAFGRLPNGAELTFWTSVLDAGTVSRSDLVVALAQSPEHLAILAKPIASASDDVIYSRDGADVIDGLAGADTVDYSSLSVSGVNADLTLGTGIQANGQIDQLLNVENLTGSSGADALTGSASSNALKGGAGDDVIDGGDGNDTLDGGAGNDTLIGGLATDTVSYASAASGVTVSLALTGAQATGGSGTDTLSGFENLTGSAFNDILTGAAGVNTLAGGKGDDTYYVQDTTDIVTEAAGEGADTVHSSVTFTLGANVENLTLTGAAAINGTGNALDNILSGNAGVNTLTGGAGNDTYIVQNATDVVTEASSAGTDTVLSSVSFTLGSNVENLTLTGADAINATGNALDNLLTGNAAVNTLTGGAGNDTYVVQNTDDVVSEAASAGTDTVVSSVTYTLSTNVENLTLTGQGAINATGNTANNVITANAGDNALDGGAGTDTVSYAAALSAVTVSLALTGAQATGGSGTDTLSGFENLTGSAFNDILTGAAGVNTLTGGKGDDTYYVQDTTDIVTEAAGEGTDTVHSSVTFTLGANVENLTLTGAAAINGTGNASNNVIVANAGNNVLGGGTGTDTVNYATATSGVTVNLGVTTAQATGGSGSDTLTGFENIIGSAFADTLTGSASVANRLTGGAGNDTYVIQDASDRVVELLDEGVDTVSSSVSYFLDANVENLTLTGTAAINATGNGLNNTITGNSGANTLDGGAGDDTLAGGLGDDIYIVDSVLDTVTENASAGTDTVRSSVTFILGDNIENLTLLGRNAANGSGNALANTIIANDGDNILDGGAGSDTLSYANAVAAVNISLALTTVQATGGSGVDTVNGFENLTGSAFNDVLTGSAGANTLTGGRGDDTYYIQDLTDLVTEAAGEGIDTVHSSVSYTLGVNVENLTLTGSAAINGTGNASDNTITANAGNNILGGGSGTDSVSYANSTAGVTVSLALTTAQITGGSGTDTLTGFENLIGSAFNDILTGSSAANILTGGRGDDLYVLQNGADSVVEAANEGIDTVESSVTHTLSAYVENLTLTGSNSINGTGNGLANFLIGNTAANTLAGGGGNDTYIIQNSGDIVSENANDGMDTVQSSVTHTLGANVENLTLTGASVINGTGNTLNNALTGNAANNSLTGGAGLDQFIFNTTLNSTTNVDTVTDFSVADDTIVLENAIFIAFGTTGGVSAGNFVIGAAADADDFLIYNATTGALSYDADGNGAGSATTFATLSASLALTNADFIVI
ncbi:MAG: DUF4214 domain-containing protein [Hyphomicrobiales bacterium]|nr:DUF4214 domain-containing protein [Hyphomicrobiales bacterium]